MPPHQQYDVVVWVSLKARVLTPAGIRDIRDSIASTLGVLQTAATQLGAPVTEEHDEGALISELHQYMETLKVFLVVDNLETLPTESLRTFLSAIPEGSKVLITSRVGLGELELRYKLDQLDTKTSVLLLRKFARSLNLELLFRAKEEILLKYTRLLFNSPLLIKWFVSSIASGADPARLVTQNNANFSEAIKFCFENLFVRLSATEKLLLYILASARRSLTLAELIFLTQESDSGEMGTPDVERALNVFHNSSMVRRTFGESDGHGLEISLTDIASEFLSRVSPPPREIVVATQARLRQLQELSERSIIKQSEYKYDIFAVRAKTKEERIAGAYLQFALHALKSKDFALARKRLEQARAMQASWSEIYRIASIVEDRAGNVPKALDLSETAVECDPASTVAIYQLSLYLFQTIEDAEQALVVIGSAIVLDPNDETLLSLKALLLTRLGRFGEAAALYEHVLKNVAARPRKWRIPTRDQAAECYRRWAQQDFLQKDDEAAFKHSQQGAAILQEGAENGDFDHKTVLRFSHVIEDALERALIRGNRNELHWCLEQLALSRMTQAPAHFVRVFFTSVDAAVKGDGDCEKLWAICTANIKSDINVGGLEADANPDELVGVIKPLPLGKKFGFIRERNGQEWFFHESNLASGTWSSVWAGRKASFQMGKSANGKPSAVNVKLL